MGYTGAQVGIGEGIFSTLWVHLFEQIPMFVHVLIRSQTAKYFPKANDEKFDVTQMTCFIYQMNWIFEENPDLESVFCTDALLHLLGPGG